MAFVQLRSERERSQTNIVTLFQLVFFSYYFLCCNNIIFLCQLSFVGFYSHYYFLFFHSNDYKEHVSIDNSKIHTWSIVLSNYRFSIDQSVSIYLFFMVDVNEDKYENIPIYCKYIPVGFIIFTIYSFQFIYIFQRKYCLLIFIFFFLRYSKRCRSRLNGLEFILDIPKMIENFIQGASLIVFITK